MTKDQVVNLVSEEMAARNIPKARWMFADKPARLVFLSADPRGGALKKEMPLKRSWSRDSIKDWVARNV